MKYGCLNGRLAWCHSRVSMPAMAPDLKQLIYCSDASEAIDAPALQLILDGARSRNAELGITGMLLYSNGRFIQVLEGEADVLEVLYAKIANDPRNDHVRTVMRRSIAERDFPNWSMAYRTLSTDDMTAHPQVNDFFSPQFDERNFREFASPARFLLLAFRDIEGDPQ
jgi:hypothetical protein